MRNDARQNGMVASREKCLLQMFLRILLYLFNSIAKTAVDLLLLLVVWIRRRVRERGSDDDDIEPIDIALYIGAGFLGLVIVIVWCCGKVLGVRV